ncbi:MAG: DUF5060 domain-containing protein, partial [Planctomycetes bacterium]|nr:DUF5060 domain-containing protein [Planctomycetota bacterium]
MLRFFAQVACLIFTTIVCVSAQVQVSEPGNAEQYGVYEITLSYDESGFANVWMDSVLSVSFNAPSGQQINTEGFYYDTNTWKIRFAPSEAGAYTWTADINGAAASGSFTSVDVGHKGFLRQHPNNIHRWIHEGDGSLYTAAGLQVWVTYKDHHQKINLSQDLDVGGFAMEERQERASWEEYLVANVDETGLNLYRWGVKNQGYFVWESQGTYSTNLVLDRKALMHTDTIFTTLRERDVRILMDFTGNYYQEFEFATAAQRKKFDAYFRHMIARYGALIDFWQLCNETTLPDDWISYACNVINTYDVYDHKISTNWDNPAHPDIEINSPHWYMPNLHEAAIDGAILAFINNGNGQTSKYAYPKPTIVTEFGVGGESYYPMHAYANSGQYWVAFFNEVALINWDQSQGKHVTLGVYMDSELRAYHRAMQNFTAKVEADAVMDSSISTTQPNNPFYTTGSYGLRSANDVYVYLINPSGDINNPITTLHINAPQAGAAMWFDPQTGDVISTLNVGAGAQSLVCPAFHRDLAFMLEGGAAFIEAPANARAGADIVVNDTDGDG